MEPTARSCIAEKALAHAEEFSPVRIPELPQYAGITFRARDVYDALELAPQHYARWAQKNIVNNPSFKQGEDGDWIEMTPTPPDGECSSRGTYNYGKEYAISMEMAKHLSMMARSERGHQVRTYFIECEARALARTSSAPALPQLPSNYISALRALADSEEQREQVKNEVAILKPLIATMQPKVDHFNRTMNTHGSFSMEKAAKMLKLGRTTLFKHLRALGVFEKNECIPYQSILKQHPGCFVVVNVPYVDEYGRVFSNPVTQVTPVGLAFLEQKLAENNLLPPLGRILRTRLNGKKLLQH